MSNEHQNEDAEVGGAMITAAVASLGDLAGAAGDPLTATALKTLAPLIGITAARQRWTWFRRGPERIAEATTHVQDRAAELGCEDTLAEAADVTEQAVPILAESASREKRRMIEDVILNAAIRSSQPGANASALRALRMIEELTPEAAVVFAAMASRPEAAGPKRFSEHTFDWNILGDLGMPYFLKHEGLEKLFALGLAKLGEYTSYQVGPEEHEHEIDDWGMTPRGGWLRDWIIANPSHRPEEEG